MVTEKVQKNNLEEELIEVTKELGELQQKIIPLYNRQQVLLVKLNKKWKENAD